MAGKIQEKSESTPRKPSPQALKAFRDTATAVENLPDWEKLRVLSAIVALFGLPRLVRNGD